MNSTPLSALDLASPRSARTEQRVAEVRVLIANGTYRPSAELVAEALLASSLVGLPPNPRALAWAC